MEKKVEIMMEKTKEEEKEENKKNLNMTGLEKTLTLKQLLKLNQQKKKNYISHHKNNQKKNQKKLKNKSKISISKRENIQMIYTKIINNKKMRTKKNSNLQDWF